MFGVTEVRLKSVALQSPRLLSTAIRSAIDSISLAKQTVRLTACSAISAATVYLT